MKKVETTSVESTRKSTRKILIVDDDPKDRAIMRKALDLDRECTIAEAEDGEQALMMIRKDPFDIVLLDITMPKLDGFKTLQAIKKLDDTIQVLMVTADVTAEAGFRAHQFGAFRYITKPALVEDEGLLLSAIAKALEHRNLVKKAKGFESQGAFVEPILSKSKVMEDVKYRLEKAASTDAPILITGESGTGKELIARSIHRQSNRGHNAFIEVNCSAIPENLLESEFFGHEKGAFTGAMERKLGKLELASEGTLFMDEIATMPMALQPKLLRALGEKRFERVGGQGTLIFTNARLISATNTDLEKEIEAGHFREDLYYRIKTLQIHIPPLRERPEDIEVLLSHFLAFFNHKYGKEVTLSETAKKALTRYAWPGNVRQLQGEIESLILITDEKEIELGVEDLPQPFLLGIANDGGEPIADGSMWAKVYEYEKQLILEALRSTEGNQTKAAELLKVNRKTLNTKMKLLGIREAMRDAASSDES